MDGQAASNEQPRENDAANDRDASGSAKIDVQRLADLVYRLAREEARLARARGARPGR